MFFAWLKKYLPRGLYGRAALILLVPVVVIQLVVLVIFSQRYFEDITQQLMDGVVSEIRLYVLTLEELPPAQHAAALAVLDQEFDFQSQLGAPAPVPERRRWFDFSSRVISAELRAGLEQIEGVDVASDTSRVALSLTTEAGRLSLQLPRRRASASNPHQLMVWTVFTSLVITLIAAIFLRNQMRPIRQLSRAAEAFGRGESVAYRPAGATEVRSAGAAFLNMRSRIERQIEQRTLMLSGVSHDLRTPLTRIRLGLSMLEVSDDDVGEVTAMQRDLDEMERLIEAFLAFSRTATVEDPVETDLSALVSEATEKARRAGGMVSLGDMPTGPTMLMARPEALTRAVDNLVSNALRYGTQTRLSITLYDRSVVISVEDDGPGIDQDRRDSALQAFVRLDSARNQNKGSGVGLGLAIAFDVARRHGGTLRLGESGALGGLRADLVLPR